MKIKKYAIFEPNLIFNGIKYEIGKRYKNNISLFSDEDIRRLIRDYIETYDIKKRFQINIIYEYDDHYVICDEINYYENIDLEESDKDLFLLLRYRDKNIINKDIDSMSIYEKIALAIVGNRINIKKLVLWIKKYQNRTKNNNHFVNLQYNILKNINKSDYLEFYFEDNSLAYLGLNNLGFKEIDKILENNKATYNELIADLGYDKYLDYFIDSKKYLKSKRLTHNILNKGRHKDIDYFMDNHNELWIANLIINNQKEEDLIQLSKNKNEDISQLANKELNKIRFT